MWARVSDCSEELLAALSSSSIIPASAIEHSLIVLPVQEMQTHPQATTQIPTGMSFSGSLIRTALFPSYVYCRDGVSCPED